MPETNYIATSTELTETADAIREKTGDSSPIEWEDGTGFANAVSAIQTELPTQTKSVTPTESAQTVTPDAGYALSEVDVGAISSTYVGSGITRRSSTDLSVNGDTVSAPAGFYGEAASKSVAAGMQGTPTISVSSGGLITASATDTTGYITGTTKTATQQMTARTSSDLTASGATVTAPAGYYNAAASKAVASGSAKPPTSISGTSATVSTGTNTLTLSKTISVTPTVTAGYVSAGAAGNVSVSLTGSVTTKAAATITPGTSNQTIAAGTYLTGAQTIEGDANLTASNIKKGVQIFGITGEYEMGSNRNLLDNWYFVGGGSQQGGGKFPINQRGNTSYSGAVYGIDRWKGSNAYGNIAVQSDGLQINSTANALFAIDQFIENGATNLNGKTVTLSVLTSSGELVKGTGTLNLTGTSQAFITIYFSSYDGIAQVNADTSIVSVRLRVQNNKTVKVAAVKLELGSVSTLANDVAPNYAEELAKCQRYYWEMKASAAYALLALGMGTASNVASFKIQHPVTMRDSASVTASGTFGCNTASFASATFRNNSGTKTTNYSVIEFDTTISQGAATTLQDFGSNNATVKFSAEL